MNLDTTKITAEFIEVNLKIDSQLLITEATFALATEIINNTNKTNPEVVKNLLQLIKNQFIYMSLIIKERDILFQLLEHYLK